MHPFKHERETRRSTKTMIKKFKMYGSVPQPFLPRGTLGQQYHYLAAPLDAKTCLEFYQIEIWRHPWHYLTASWLRTTGLGQYCDKKLSLIEDWPGVVELAQILHSVNLREAWWHKVNRVDLSLTSNVYLFCQRFVPKLTWRPFSWQPLVLPELPVMG